LVFGWEKAFGAMQQPGSGIEIFNDNRAMAGKKHDIAEGSISGGIIYIMYAGDIQGSIPCIITYP
jgi:hypothetical protein